MGGTSGQYSDNLARVPVRDEPELGAFDIVDLRPSGAPRKGLADRAKEERAPSRSDELFSAEFEQRYMAIHGGS